MSNENEILNKILNEYTITQALSKIFSGEYVSTKMRKEAMKKAIDIVADEEKAKKSSEKFQNFFCEKLFKNLEGTQLKNAKSAFRALSTLIIASVFAKRIITPYIACKMSDEKS